MRQHRLRSYVFSQVADDDNDDDVFLSSNSLTRWMLFLAQENRLVKGRKTETREGAGREGGWNGV